MSFFAFVIQRGFQISMLAGLAALLALSSGCKKQTPPAAGGPPAGGAPATQVIAVEAKRQRVAETLALVGTVQANEMVELKAQTEGLVTKILFEEGQPVKQGDALIQLDESKLAASVAEQEANFKLSEVNYERGRQLFADRLISQQEIDQLASVFQASRASLELNKQRLADTRIVAPFGGVVGARNISPGQVIARDTVLTWLVDADPVKVEFSVPERFLNQLAVKQQIEVGIAAYPNRKFKGTVFFISPFVDQQSRTALVKAEIPNPKGELKPGMFANLELTLTIRNDSVVVPEAALSSVLENNGAMIWIVDQNETAQMRRIRVGVRFDRQVEVLEGLQGGEKVIVEGLQKIAPGAKVRLAPPEAAAPYLPTLKS